HRIGGDAAREHPPPILAIRDDLAEEIDIGDSAVAALLEPADEAEDRGARRLDPHQPADLRSGIVAVLLDEAADELVARDGDDGAEAPRLVAGSARCALGCEA